MTLYTMPPRFWKWRTRGAAPHFAFRIPSPGDFDLVLATDLINLAELRGLWPAGSPPLLLYFHENQLLYPLSPGEQRDFHYGLTDVLSSLAARRIVFNSRVHEASFFEELPRFLSRFPDYPLTGRIPELKGKSSVLYPGIEPDLFPSSCDSEEVNTARRKAPLIVWNHRWEHDKNPEGFFRPLFRLAEEDVPFRVAVMGEQFKNVPAVFEEARRNLGGRIVRFGFADDRREYFEVLREADIVVSTAFQENFGIAVLEAVRCGCRPLLPNRLSYPELIPPRFHGEVLYRDEDDLYRRLRELLGSETELRMQDLAEETARFEWPRLIGDYDALCEELA